nr:MAG TPA_asm: hypothetical protein [Caudoviricetes sp.]
MQRLFHLSVRTLLSHSQEDIRHRFRLCQQGEHKYRRLSE